MLHVLVNLKCQTIKKEKKKKLPFSINSRWKSEKTDTKHNEHYCEAVKNASE